MISTLDAHSENDPEFRDWPPHCVAGTAGQQKPAATLLEKRDIVPNRPGQADFDGAQQILLEKQALDCFTNVNLPALLDRFGAQRYVVYGVVTEICVRHAALGLLKTGARVELVTDAVCSLNREACAAFLNEFTAAGGVPVSAQTVQSGLRATDRRVHQLNRVDHRHGLPVALERRADLQLASRITRRHNIRLQRLDDARPCGPPVDPRSWAAPGCRFPPNRNTARSPASPALPTPVSRPTGNAVACARAGRVADGTNRDTPPAA